MQDGYGRRGPTGLDVDTTTHQLVATVEGAVVRVDPATLAVTGSLSTRSAGTVAVNSHTGRAVVAPRAGASNPGSVDQVDIATMTLVSSGISFFDGANSTGLALDELTNTAFVTFGAGRYTPPDQLFAPTYYTAGSVLAVDLATGQGSTILVPGDPEAIALDEVTRTGFVTEQDGTVGVLDLDAKRLSGSTAATGSYPSAVAVDRASHVAYVNGRERLVALRQSGTTAPTTMNAVYSPNLVTGNPGVLLTVRIDGAGSGYVAFSGDRGNPTPINGCGHQPVIAGYSYCVTTFLPGPVAISATYGGDPSHAASTTTTQLTVGPASPDPVGLALGQLLRQLDLLQKLGQRPY